MKTKSKTDNSAKSPQTAQDALQAHGGHTGAYSHGLKADALQRTTEGIHGGQAGKAVRYCRNACLPPPHWQKLA
jgi:hypothetical protein